MQVGLLSKTKRTLCSGQRQNWSLRHSSLPENPSVLRGRHRGCGDGHQGQLICFPNSGTPLISPACEARAWRYSPWWSVPCGRPCRHSPSHRGPIGVWQGGWRGAQSPAGVGPVGSTSPSHRVNVQASCLENRIWGDQKDGWWRRREWENKNATILHISAQVTDVVSTISGQEKANRTICVSWWETTTKLPVHIFTVWQAWIKCGLQKLSASAWRYVDKDGDSHEEAKSELSTCGGETRHLACYVHKHVFFFSLLYNFHYLQMLQEAKVVEALCFFILSRNKRQSID